MLGLYVVGSITGFAFAIQLTSFFFEQKAGTLRNAHQVRKCFVCLSRGVLAHVLPPAHFRSTNKPSLFLRFSAPCRSWRVTCGSVIDARVTDTTVCARAWA